MEPLPHVARIIQHREMKYYDLKKNWRRVRRHLGDKELNDILVRDFNKYIFGLRGEKFTRGRLPREIRGYLLGIESEQKRPTSGLLEIY